MVSFKLSFGGKKIIKINTEEWIEKKLISMLSKSLSYSKIRL